MDVHGYYATHAGVAVRQAHNHYLLKQTTNQKLMTDFGHRSDDESLAHAIVTGDLETLRQRRDEVRVAQALPLSVYNPIDTRLAPPLIMALELVAARPLYDFEPRVLIECLVRECGVDPNALCEIHGGPQPSFATGRTYTIEPEIEEVQELPRSAVIHTTPLARAIVLRVQNSRYIDLNCIEALLDSGADPNAPLIHDATHLEQRHDHINLTEDESIWPLSFALLSGVPCSNEYAYELAHTLVAHGAVFAPGERAPLARALRLHGHYAHMLLELLVPILTPQQRLEPDPTSGLNAMQHWVRLLANDEHDWRATLQEFLDQGFRATDALPHAEAARQRYNGAGFHPQAPVSACVNLLRTLAIRERAEEQRRYSMAVHRTLHERGGLPPGVQDHIASFMPPGTVRSMYAADQLRERIEDVRRRKATLSALN